MSKEITGESDRTIYEELDSGDGHALSHRVNEARQSVEELRLPQAEVNDEYHHALNSLDTTLQQINDAWGNAAESKSLLRTLDQFLGEVKGHLHGTDFSLGGWHQSLEALQDHIDDLRSTFDPA